MFIRRRNQLAKSQLLHIFHKLLTVCATDQGIQRTPNVYLLILSFLFDDYFLEVFLRHIVFRVKARLLAQFFGKVRNFLCQGFELIRHSLQGLMSRIQGTQVIQAFFRLLRFSLAQGEIRGYLFNLLRNLQAKHFRNHSILQVLFRTEAVLTQLCLEIRIQGFLLAFAFRNLPRNRVELRTDRGEIFRAAFALFGEFHTQLGNGIDLFLAFTAVFCHIARSEKFLTFHHTILGFRLFLAQVVFEKAQVRLCGFHILRQAIFVCFKNGDLSFARFDILDAGAPLRSPGANLRKNYLRHFEIRFRKTERA